MEIGGRDLVRMPLAVGENLQRKSKGQVEEVSKEGKALMNLFLTGGTFHIGRLFLTNHRLILLPYSEAEVRKASTMKKITYGLLGQTKLNIPEPKINFQMQVLTIPLREVRTINPFRKHRVVHPCMYVLTRRGNYKLKFVPNESPMEWARAIASLAPIKIADVVPR
ncbi:MAG: hypothetical protein V3U06_01280 [Candidatus Binatia bacterium]